MKAKWIIIDGYSLVYRDPTLQSILHTSPEMARHHLIRKLEQVAQDVAERITIIFDGQSKGHDDQYDPGVVEVIFTSGNQTADTMIEQLIHRVPNPAELMVVTSDSHEARTVDAAGASCMSCRSFLELIEPCSRRVPRQKVPAIQLGDFFPDKP